MTLIYNRKSLKEKRQFLRANQTSPEKAVWENLRNKKLGEKFFRQYSVGPYILDFYCPSRRLAVEIDGGYHQTINQKKYDEFRSKYLLAGGIKTLRFSNDFVTRNTTKVIKSVFGYLQTPSLLKRGMKGEL